MPANSPMFGRTAALRLRPAILTVSPGNERDPFGRIEVRRLEPGVALCRDAAILLADFELECRVLNASQPLRNIDICRMVKRRLGDAGLPTHLSPHSFRVATVTDLLTQGVALKDVQYLAGHADPRTTRGFMIEGKSSYQEHGGGDFDLNAAPVGVILCAEKNHAVARYTLGGLPNKVLAADYRTTFPDEKTLATEVETKRRLLKPGSRSGRADHR
jgi:hypothetical protein